MLINEVARLTGITVRTLHYYDDIGLLKPFEVTAAGYRVYGEDDLMRLQQILFLRELSFPLSEIKEILASKGYDKRSALLSQRELLIKKQTRLSSLIDLIDNTLKGENDMSFKQFDMKDIENAKRKYAAEVKERWGDTEAYSESEKKTAGYDSAKWEEITGEMNDIFSEFAGLRGGSPGSREAAALVERWQEHINKNYYSCPNEMLCCLGEMYVNDERYKQNIDKAGEGTAEFIAAAIREYCGGKQD